MLRWVGASLVCLGCALIALGSSDWNPRLVGIPVPGEHGVHALDVVGFAIAVGGVAALWVAPRRPSR